MFSDSAVSCCYFALSPCNTLFSTEADVYNASISKDYGNVFEKQLQQNVLFVVTDSIKHNFTLRECLWGAGCYNM
jgi:hypothetical protein